MAHGAPVIGAQQRSQQTRERTAPLSSKTSGPATEMQKLIDISETTPLLVRASVRAQVVRVCEGLDDYRRARSARCFDASQEPLTTLPA